MSVRLLYLVSHPIQYQAPLLRRIAAEPGIRLRVLFERDTEDGYFDPGFGRHVRWDVPLRQGYDSAVVSRSELAAEIAAAQVVWLHGWQGAWMRHALITARRLGRPVLMRGENTDAAMPDGDGVKGWLKRRYLSWIFTHVSAFLAIGSANRAYYRRRGIADERIFTMPYAIDNDAFMAAADAANGIDGLGLEPGRPVILYAGKLMARKHPHTLLAAWKRAEWAGPRPHLLFVGDGELRQSLEAEAEPGVIFAGFRNQGALPALYAGADIFVLASEREPWGLAVNEAMACGTAIITGDQVGCADDLIDGQCGAVVPAGDVAALARALTELLPRAEQAGHHARRRIRSWGFEADVTGLKAALTWLGMTP